MNLKQVALASSLFKILREIVDTGNLGTAQAVVQKVMNKGFIRALCHNGSLVHQANIPWGQGEVSDEELQSLFPQQRQQQQLQLQQQQQLKGVACKDPVVAALAPSPLPKVGLECREGVLSLALVLVTTMGH